MTTARTRPRAVFREKALRRYAANRQRTEPVRDVSARLLVALWLCAALLSSGVIAVAICVDVLLP